MTDYNEIVIYGGRNPNFRGIFSVARPRLQLLELFQVSNKIANWAAILTLWQRSRKLAALKKNLGK
jgi:hypothetical protein